MSKISKNNFLGLLFKSAMRLKVFSSLLFSLIVVLPASVFAGTIDLPRTGQTKCYDSARTEITCAGTGQDGEIQAGVAWPDPRFSFNSDTTITDNLTGLIWTKDAGTPTYNGSSSTCTGGTKTWTAALDYVACLNTNNYLGHNDWQLPNVNELESLVNAEQSNQATWLNAQLFYNVQSGYYWSSTTVAVNTNYARQVNMLAGIVDEGYDKTNANYL